jgi:hypothetical protein
MRGVPFLAAFAIALATTPAEAATQVVRWSPFRADGALRTGLVATPAFGGDCFTGSFAVHRAYRCIHGHLLEDPCFADPSRSRVVVCVRSPFARGVIRLRVSERLSNRFSASTRQVWAIRLASGQRCVFFAGGATSADSAGRRANYGCSGRQTILWGDPIRSRATWRIRLSHSFTPGPERLVSIKTAYIGRA